MTITHTEVTAETLNGFVNGLQAKVNEYFAAHWPNNKVPTITVEEGPKNIRVIKDEGAGSRSVHCFIIKSTGEIRKAAGWRAAAKGSRGNINTPTFGVEYTTWNGVPYLR